MKIPSTSINDRIRSDLYPLMDQYRTQCLWYLRKDYYPPDEDQAIRVLQAIEQHGDREAYIKAREIRKWLYCKQYNFWMTSSFSPEVFRTIVRKLNGDGYITEFQRSICRLIAKNRLDHGESYVPDSAA